MTHEQEEDTRSLHRILYRWTFVPSFEPIEVELFTAVMAAQRLYNAVSELRADNPSIQGELASELSALRAMDTNDFTDAMLDALADVDLEDWEGEHGP